MAKKKKFNNKLWWIISVNISLIIIAYLFIEAKYSSNDDFDEDINEDEQLTTECFDRGYDSEILEINQEDCTLSGHNWIDSKSICCGYESDKNVCKEIGFKDILWDSDENFCDMQDYHWMEEYETCCII